VVVTVVVVVVVTVVGLGVPVPVTALKSFASISAAGVSVKIAKSLPSSVVITVSLTFAPLPWLTSS
jgi:hypothetical protein